MARWVENGSIYMGWKAALEAGVRLRLTRLRQAAPD